MLQGFKILDKDKYKKISFRRILIALLKSMHSLESKRIFDILKFEDLRNIFRLIAFLEGLSYILLLGLAVPTKYLLNDPQYVQLLGMPHGILFILYLVLAIWLKPEYKWTRNQFFWVLLASVIPFGTFIVDKNYLKPQIK